MVMILLVRTEKDVTSILSALRLAIRDGDCTLGVLEVSESVYTCQSETCTADTSHQAACILNRILYT